MIIAVLGCGNMASAIIEGVAKTKHKFEFLTYTPTFKRAEELASKINGKAVRELSELSHADYFLIGCKPQQFKELSKQLDSQIPKHSKILSILAGTTVSTIAKNLDTPKVSRIMPNTPIQKGEGVSLIFHAPEVEDSQKLMLQKLLGATSLTALMDSEEMLDKITGISGSGPALVFAICESFVMKMKEFGLNEELAGKIIKKTFLGSSMLMSESDDSLQTLRENVTSKGGVTHEALESMKRSDLEALVSDAMDSAYKRTSELSRM